MLRLLSDENFNGAIVRGLRLRQPAIDLVRVQDVGLSGADDTAVLEWAAQNDRVLVTHDKATIPAFAYDRLTAGRPMPGVFVLNNRVPIHQAIDELLRLDACSEQAEWSGLVVFLPIPGP
jgi:predicted nuclease of predicted toxin-antitoxin system